MSDNENEHDNTNQNMIINTTDRDLLEENNNNNNNEENLDQAEDIEIKQRKSSSNIEIDTNNNNNNDNNDNNDNDSSNNNNDNESFENKVDVDMHEKEKRHSKKKFSVLKPQNKESPLLKYNYDADSKDCENGTSNIPAKYFSELVNHKLINYLDSFLIPKKTFFCTKISSESIMKWQSSLIDKPLTNVPQEYIPIAVQIFKNLMGYMGDIKSSKKTLDHIKKFLRLCYNAPIEIKDEAFVQILKQSKDHKDYSGSLKAWKAFALLSSTISPSPQLFYSLLNFLLFEIKTNEDENIVHHANFIFVRLYKTYSQGRKHPPDTLEITSVEQLKPIPISVYLFNGEEVKVPIESYTTIRELKSMVMRKMNFATNKIPYFGIYEVCSRTKVNEERFIEENDKVADILSLWAKDLEASFKTRESIEFKMYLKIMLYYSYVPGDETSDYLYHQSVYDFLNGRYDFDYTKCIEFAATKLFIEVKEMDEAFTILNENIENYLPYDRLEDIPKVEYSEKIMQAFTELSVTNAEEAKILFLDKMSESPLHKGHQFKLRFPEKNNTVNHENYPENIIGVFKPNDISFYTLDKEVLSCFKYNEIINWGISTLYFVFVVPQEDDLNHKIYFESKQTKMIQHILESYTNIIAGKSIAELDNVIKESEKRFDEFPINRERNGSIFNK